MSEVTLKELREFLSTYLAAKKLSNKLYSQRALAANIGIDQAGLSRFIRGLREPRKATLEKILAFCGKTSVMKVVAGPTIVCPRCLHQFGLEKK